MPELPYPTRNLMIATIGRLEEADAAHQEKLAAAGLTRAGRNVLNDPAPAQVVLRIDRR